jgi:hypothetical protein
MTKREFIKTERLRIFNLKIELERTMRRDLKSYFNKQRKRVRKGDEPQTIEPVLRKHYDRVVRKLMHRNIKQVDRIDEAVRAFIEDRAVNRSKVIDNTTQNVLEKSIEDAREQLAKDGNATPTDRELMIAASVIFARKNRGRVTTIANTETQTTTEGLRQTITLRAHEELEDVIIDRDKEKAEEIYKISRSYTAYEIKEKISTAEIATLTTIIVTAEKEWQTMGDNLVRPTKPSDKFNHREANGQRVLIMEAFIVSGEMLNYPGDYSLGASKGNTIGCRCIVIY